MLASTRVIYTLLTSAYNGTVNIGTSATAFLDKELAEEVMSVVESINENAFLRVHCRIVESTLVTSRDEVDILNPEVAAQRKSEISANEDMLCEQKKTTRGVDPVCSLWKML